MVTPFPYPTLVIKQQCRQSILWMFIDIFSNNFAGSTLFGPYGGQTPTLLSYYNGFCISQSLGPTAGGVYIVPDAVRPLELISIWIQGCVNQGVPLSMGIAGGGGYYNPAVNIVSDTLPTRGWKSLSIRRSVYSS